MLRLGETSSGLDRIALLGGYFMSAIEHYSTLTAGQGTPSLEWTATFRHESEGTRYKTYDDLVHATDSTLVVGQGIPSLKWTAIFGHDSEGTRYETDDVEGTGHETDLVRGPNYRTVILEGYVMPVVEHYSTLAAGQGTLSLKWTATFGHDT
uniref:Uncharacterized protein n=1 Tax=Solanum tuberosum TaxID=4113 RepID=M1A8M3_SOLTU